MDEDMAHDLPIWQLNPICYRRVSRLASALSGAASAATATGMWGRLVSGAVIHLCEEPALRHSSTLFPDGPVHRSPRRTAISCWQNAPNAPGTDGRGHRTSE